MQTGLKSHIVPFPYYSPRLAVGTLGLSCPPPLSPASKTFQMDIYPPVSLSPPWQMYYFAEFLALRHHKWLWNWLLSLVHLHHQCRQQERCARLEDHVCVRKRLQSLRESTDTGYWCDACKHLKRDFRKAGYFCLQITGLWSSEFSSFSQGDTQFQSSICIWHSPITLFHVFILHLTAPHQQKTRNLLQLFSLHQNAIESLQFPCFLSPLYKNAAWCARLNQVSQRSVFWSQGKLPRRGSEITGVPLKPLPASCSGRADANKSLTTTPLPLMDLAPGHTA